MATPREHIDYLLEQLEPLPVRARAMFGEYGLYCDEKIVGFVCDSTVFLKPGPVTAHLPQGPCYPGSKDYGIVDDGVVADSAAFRDLVRATADSLPPPKPKKPRGQPASTDSSRA